MTQRDPLAGRTAPFRTMERLANEMDRIFDAFGFGRGRLAPFSAGSPRSWWHDTATNWNVWAPDIDVFQRNDELVVRADLPGLNKEDVNIDVTEDAVTIHGERHHEAKQEDKGIYRSERAYGSFSRTIALPEGAITDQAKATFKDGVLEITMPSPPHGVTRGRRLAINEGSSEKK
jgi:HSP20 family protein